MSDSAEEQLAELQLLRRVDHDGDLITQLHSPSGARVGGGIRMLTVHEEDGQGEGEESEEEESVESSPTTHVSSFNAIFGASRRLAGNSKPELSISTDIINSESSVDDVSPTTDKSFAELRPKTDSESNQPYTQYNINNEKQVSEKSEVPIDPAFEEMLEQLPHDISFLTLSISDISVSNLIRIRDAAQQHIQAHSDSQSTVEAMRAVRTLMAIDTLRLLLKRYKVENVIPIMTTVMQDVFETYAQDCGIKPLAVSPGVITCRNIARIIILVRKSLIQQHDQSKELSPPSTPISPRRITRSSTRSTRARSLSPTSHTSLTSPTTRTRAVMSPRSILASEGMHLLIHEKIQSFHYRDTEKIPSLRVRRESAAATEEAARRRQRSMHYGYETTQAVLRHSHSASTLSSKY